jgi:hypothetical protein
MPVIETHTKPRIKLACCKIDHHANLIQRWHDHARQRYYSNGKWKLRMKVGIVLILLYIFGIPYLAWHYINPWFGVYISIPCIFGGLVSWRSLFGTGIR